jgi:hypothetical protein
MTGRLLNRPIPRETPPVLMVAVGQRVRFDGHRMRNERAIHFHEAPAFDLALR